MADLFSRTWNNTPITRRTTDDYVNATAICKANGKQWNDYWRTDRATEYLEALSAETGIPVSSLCISTKGGAYQGTWIHPRAAVDLTRWISADFAVWMDGFLLDVLERPAQAIETLVPRLDEKESEWLEARLNAKRTRNTFTNELKEFGVERDGYGRCTNAIYRPILGQDAKGLKESLAQKTNLPVKAINPRDHMTVRELQDVESAERIAVGQLKRTEAHGNREAERVVKASAEYTRKLLDGDITIPGL